MRSLKYALQYVGIITGSVLICIAIYNHLSPENVPQTHVFIASDGTMVRNGVVVPPINNNASTANPVRSERYVSPTIHYKENGTEVWQNTTQPDSSEYVNINGQMKYCTSYYGSLSCTK